MAVTSVVALWGQTSGKLDLNANASHAGCAGLRRLAVNGRLLKGSGQGAGTFGTSALDALSHAFYISCMFFFTFAVFDL